jgi:hypothetical protein
MTDCEGSSTVVGQVESRVSDMATAELVPMGTIVAQLGDQIAVGAGHKGGRVVIDVTELTLKSERVNATLATNDAADWATVGEDGRGALDVRLTLKTDDGAFIYVEYQGRIDMGSGLIAAAPTFQTGDERYAWLNDVQAVSAGQVNLETGVLQYTVYEVKVTAD